MSGSTLLIDGLALGDVGVLDLFLASCQADPSRVAVVDDRGCVWTRGDLKSAASGIGRDLVEAGSTSGEPVVLCMPNRAEWLAAYLGTLMAECIPATLPVTSDAAAVAVAMGQVGARLVLLASTHRRRDFRAETRIIGENLGSRMSALLVDDDSGQVERITVEGPTAELPALPEGTAHILFSSSTTGAPKAIAHSEASLAAYNLGLISRYSVTDEDTIFMPSPLGHSTGVWHGARMSLLTGARLVVQDAWDAAEALRLADAYEATITVAATPFLKDIVECLWADTPKFKHMRTFLCGGAQVPPELLERAASELPDTFVGAVWAMSEGGATSSLPSDPSRKVTQTCGVPFPGVTLKTITEQGWVNPSGVEGELVMRTPSLCLSYVGHEELYLQCFTGDGYFRTGDLATLDDEGYMTITGRVKDIIIRGGVNIAVVGMPDDRMGERICAVVVTHSGNPLILEDLKPWLRSSALPKRMWPETLVSVKSLPMTPAGKIRKRLLVEELWK
jgi:acyl-CoA synthetase (AMP-forming)/AMP-acid ligase II